MKIIKCLILIVIHLAACMLGYGLIEKWRPMPAFYAALQTLFPFTFGSSLRLTQTGFIFNIVMKFLGIGVLIYIISNVACFMIEDRLKAYLKADHDEPPPPPAGSCIDLDGQPNVGVPGQVAEVELVRGSYLVGRTQRSSNIRYKTGASILCLTRSDEVHVNPGLNKRFHEKDRLLVFGTDAQINEFMKLACADDSSRGKSAGSGLLGKWLRKDGSRTDQGDGAEPEKQETAEPLAGEAVQESPDEPEAAGETAMAQGEAAKDASAGEPEAARENPDPQSEEAVPETSEKEPEAAGETPAAQSRKAGKENRGGTRPDKSKKGKTQSTLRKKITKLMKRIR